MAKEEMSYGEDYKYIPATSRKSGEGVELLTDLYYHTIQIVNIVFVGDPGTKDFVLVDAGTPKSANEIISITEDRFGTDVRPKAIILTHGHFDHVGSIIELVRYWDIPVFAHEMEIPFLMGKKSYPDPDASVEGGMVAKMSPLFPNEPINLKTNVNNLPPEGQVPHLPGFRWIHTPGHSPGHVSLFREEDGVLIAGDAFVTVKQESLYKVMKQEKEISGPPRYLTTDWKAARESVEKLASLNPSIGITGHGPHMTGEELTSNLDKLVREFDEIAVPDHGKYVDEE